MSRTKEFYHDQITQGLLFPDDTDYDYTPRAAESGSTTEAWIRAQGEKLGILAHRESRVRTPFHDPALRELLNEQGWCWTRAASDAWLKGWDHERTIAMLDGLYAEMIARWEAEEADREGPRYA